MLKKGIKFLLVAGFSLFTVFVSGQVHPTQEENKNEEAPKEEKINPAKIILEHISDAHDFHFLTIGEHHVSIPLPVILYTKEKGFSIFMSSKFHHGEETHEGFRLLDEKFMEEHKLEEVKDEKGQPVYHAGTIYAVDEAGMPDLKVNVYDVSLTKNVVQMIIALFLLVYMMMKVAGLYKKGQGTKTAPAGFQNMVEPVITFVRDEVAKPNLGHKYNRYLPYLLTVFFFILINNLFGLIPGTANVTGNIAFTAVLGVISFLVILFSTNKHFWGHIFNPPGVPMAVKPILVPVELMGVITKPFALIIRLFANMVAGHIIILSFICLIFIFGAMSKALGWGTSPIFVLLAVFIYMIEVLVAFIQAFIFTNLTAVFIGQAFEGEHHDEAHH